MSYKLPGDAHPPITREEVEAFITALNYGMKVSHKPEFLIALAEGWIKNQESTSNLCHEKGHHTWETIRSGSDSKTEKCTVCGLVERTVY